MVVDKMASQGTLTEGGRFNTIDLLVPTSLDDIHITFYDFTKQAILLRRYIVLSLPLWLVFLVQVDETTEHYIFYF